ncbi:MAG: hypothetical protein H6738_21325 [Alphaproteobacteria bacterium]|nr:hypothetical protein [Alphaproteobacteria bacterium]
MWWISLAWAGVWPPVRHSTAPLVDPIPTMTCPSPPDPSSPEVRLLVDLARAQTGYVGPGRIQWTCPGLCCGPQAGVALFDPEGTLLATAMVDGDGVWVGPDRNAWRMMPSAPAVAGAPIGAAGALRTAHEALLRYAGQDDVLVAAASEHGGVDVWLVRAFPTRWVVFAEAHVDDGLVTRVQRVERTWTPVPGAVAARVAAFGGFGE